MEKQVIISLEWRIMIYPNAQYEQVIFKTDCMHYIKVTNSKQEKLNRQLYVQS